MCVLCIQGTTQDGSQTSQTSGSTTSSGRASVGDHAGAGLPEIPASRQQRPKGQQPFNRLWGTAQQVDGIPLRCLEHLCSYPDTKRLHLMWTACPATVGKGDHASTAGLLISCAWQHDRADTCAGSAAAGCISCAEGAGSGHYAGQRGLPGPGGTLCRYRPQFRSRPRVTPAQQAPPLVPSHCSRLWRRYTSLIILDTSHATCKDSHELKCCIALVRYVGTMKLTEVVLNRVYQISSFHNKKSRDSITHDLKTSDAFMQVWQLALMLPSPEFSLQWSQCCRSQVPRMTLGTSWTAQWPQTALASL